jgi:hypothetical protein
LRARQAKSRHEIANAREDKDSDYCWNVAKHCVDSVIWFSQIKDFPQTNIKTRGETSGEDMLTFKDWWTTVDPTFVFLLALPFAVALAGLVSYFLRKRTRRN